MKKVRYISFFVLMFLYCYAYTQRYTPSIKEIQSTLETFSHYTTKNKKISYRIFNSFPLIEDCCHKNIIDSISGLFYIENIDSIMGYDINLQQSQIFILDVVCLKIETIKSSLPLENFDTISLSFNVLLTECQSQAKQFFIHDTCYMEISAYFDRLPPKLYHGYKMPLCIDSLYIPSFPIGLLGNFYIAIRNTD